MWDSMTCSTSKSCTIDNTVYVLAVIELTEFPIEVWRTVAVVPFLTGCASILADGRVAEFASVVGRRTNARVVLDRIAGIAV
jgi:hypothetical protein